ncbi:MAG TPA: VOC family protein [Gaiellaceae bacterium]|nr:VOC family protein [Gaiellaceae bacterium]
MKLARVLETVLYCAAEEEEETRRFYRELLGLQPVSDESSGFRVGSGIFLLFNRDRTSVQDWPPPHGAAGPGHTCFLAEPGEYEAWKQRIEAAGVEIVDETEWQRGPRSFYFEDPAGNVVEIAEADMWP